MKAQSKFISILLVMIVASQKLLAGTPGNKRTIYTSGETVFPIHYQLGQSTVLYLGVKPEVVICGNKNYFNIEKLKEGITIQPLSTISTNLSILSGNKRYLFYLTPSKLGLSSDGFVDVKWVSANQIKLAPAQRAKSEIIRELSQRIELTPNLSFFIRRQIFFKGSNKIVLEIEIKTLKQKIFAKELMISAFSNGDLVKKQVLVWKKDIFFENEINEGRLILINPTVVKTKHHLDLSVSMNGKTYKIGISNGKK